MTNPVKILLAAAAGFAAGILLAPKSGRETRQDIMDKANDARDYAGKKADQVKKAAHEGAKTLKQSADKAGEELSGMAKSARDSATVMRDEAGRLGEEAKVRASRVGDNAKQTAASLKAEAQKNLR